MHDTIGLIDFMGLIDFVLAGVVVRVKVRQMLGWEERGG